MPDPTLTPTPLMPCGHPLAQLAKRGPGSYYCPLCHTTLVAAAGSAYQPREEGN